MTYEEMQAYIAWHCCDRTIGQIKEYLGITTQRVRDIYDTVFNRPVENFPEPAPDGMRKVGETYTGPAGPLIEKAILDRFFAGQSNRKIVSELGVPHRMVYETYKKHGLKRPIRPGSLRELIYKAVNGNRTTSDIARHLGRSYNSAYHGLTSLAGQGLVYQDQGKKPVWRKCDNGMD